MGELLTLNLSVLILHPQHLNADQWTNTGPQTTFSFLETPARFAFAWRLCGEVKVECGRSV